MSLKIHGDYEIKVVGEIYIIRAYNSWNVDCSKTFINDYKNKILENKFKKFGVLGDLRKLEGATPDAIQLFKNLSTWTYEKGQIARAIVYNYELEKYIAKLALKYELFPTMNFDKEKTALLWLEEQGLKISNS